MTTQAANALLKISTCLSIILVGSMIRGYSQQQGAFTQYMFNSLLINPAYAGYAGGGKAVEINAVAREQWIGIKGAPSTQSLSVHAPIKKTNMGIGIQVIHDKIGPTREVGSYFSYAYHIPFRKKNITGKRSEEKGKLSLGLQAGMSYFVNDFTSLKVNTRNDNNADPQFASNENKKVLFNVGAGIFYYTKKFYLGVSVPYILNNMVWQGAKQARHMFCTGGYLFDVTPSIKIKPSFLVKAVIGAPVQVHLNANVLIKNIVWVGASWRSMTSVNVLIAYQISPKIRVGYAYDITTTSPLSQVGGGAHELMFKYRIPLIDTKIISPRHF